ncbi:hypothetical protein HZS61_013313 [Fusarium oxysporum f. sp. conglutinans]|uniref:Uncharacterized protein n=1 Tax=Fusarium oxysporum f. sp. conglutinans TaxID=100902 RepID=A0A8H6GQM9_FUSOX|nr:hypothetical protein HZS61_013313 [Fusarium oxysporum f. sp. conglutinans]
MRNRRRAWPEHVGSVILIHENRMRITLGPTLGLGLVKGFNGLFEQKLALHEPILNVTCKYNFYDGRRDFGRGRLDSDLMRT